MAVFFEPQGFPTSSQTLSPELLQALLPLHLQVGGAATSPLLKTTTSLSGSPLDPNLINQLSITGIVNQGTPGFFSVGGGGGIPFNTATGKLEPYRIPGMTGTGGFKTDFRSFSDQLRDFIIGGQPTENLSIGGGQNVPGIQGTSAFFNPNPTFTPQELANLPELFGQPSASGTTDYEAILRKILGGSMGGSPTQTPPPGTSLSLPGGSLPVQPTAETPFAPSVPGFENLFQDYVKSIQAPSSVEEVRKGLESDALNQALAEIDRGTRAAAGSAKLDFLDRGIGGPGQISDIEANALAQLQAGGERTKAQARSQLLLAQLQRQADKEAELRGAFGKRFETGAQIGARESEVAKTLSARKAETDLDRLNSGLTTIAKLSSDEKTNLLNNLFQAVLEGKKLSQNDTQFFAKLLQEKQIAQLEANTKLSLGQLNKESQNPDFFSNLLSGFAGGFSGGFGGTFGKRLGEAI